MVYSCCYWYHTVPKIWNKNSQKWNCTASFPISTFMFLEAIYIFPPLVIFWISFTLESKKKLTTRINCFHLWSVIFRRGNLYVGHLCELSAEGSAGNCCQPLLGGSSLPFSLLLELSCEFSHNTVKIEIPNITFTGHSFAVQCPILIIF